MQRHVTGHTLLELLVVIMIMGLLAGIVIPNTSMDDARKLDTLQLAIQDALDHAQSLSYHQGVPYGVRFNVNGQWFAVVNENGVPVDDPLSHGDYLIRLESPDMPSAIRLDYAMFGPRPLAVFNTKGVLMFSGEVRLRAGESERILECDTATAKLAEVYADDPN